MASGSGPDKKLNLPKKESKSKIGQKISGLKLAALTKSISLSASHWDPLASVDWDQAGEPGTLATTRIKRDLTSLIKDPLPGIFIIPDESNFCIVHCLIVGPFDTPYEGGFFNFVVRFGPSYPLHPPRVRFLTTDVGKVRFNPNLYANGKVCLSILGTWTGPSWSPASNLGSLLLSIQSLLNEKPYFNEPGFQKEHFSGESERYNEFITHETIRVAVCSHMENAFNQNYNYTREEFVSVAKSTFLDFYDHYIDICKRNMSLDKTNMKDVFSLQNLKFNFGSLKTRLEAIKEKLRNYESEGEDIATGRESPLSTISDTSDGNAKQDASAIICEANEFALTEEEELEMNSASGTSDHLSADKFDMKKAGSQNQEHSDDWFFIDEEEFKDEED